MSGVLATGPLVATPGFESARVGGALVVALPEAMLWARRAVQRSGSLYAAALKDAKVRLEGRGAVPVISHPDTDGPDWAVRHYRRGGAMRFLGDRFPRVGRPRCFLEVESSVRARALGIATPRIIAAAAYPTGLLYRADLVTEYVYDARELADVLLGGTDPAVPPADAETRASALRSVDRLVTEMAKNGVRHPDMNARNVLLAPGRSGMRAVLLDLDRCVIGGPRAPDAGHGLRRRLARSLRKLERTRPGRLHDDDLQTILTGAERP